MAMNGSCAFPGNLDCENWVKGCSLMPAGLDFGCWRREGEEGEDKERLGGVPSFLTHLRAVVTKTGHYDSK